MGFLDRLTGRPAPEKATKEKEPEHAPSTSAPAAAPVHHEIMHDAAPSSGSYGPPGISASTPGLSNLTALGSLGGAPGMGAGPSSGRIYDPYEGISQAIGVKKHAFKLPDQPEFVFEEEAAVRRRGFSESLQFYTGLGYVTGGVAGVGAGAVKFISSKPEIPGPETLRLKTNRLLNSAGSFARPLGHGCGILGLYFASLESLVTNQLDLPVPQAVNSVMAGALAGALFRSPRGPRQAAAAAVVGVAGGAGVAALRTVFPSL